MKKYNRILLLTMIHIALPLSLLYAHPPAINHSSNTIQPHITAEVLAGNHTLGLVDALIPMPINQELNKDELLFLDGRGHISSDASEEINLGLGYRRILGNQSYILGGYAFYDGMASPQDHYLQEMTVGIERLGHLWDGRANYYQPIGKKKFEISRTYSNPTIAEHFVTVNHEEKFETAVPGYDIELGGVLTGNLPRGLKGFLSYYHFGWHNDAKMDGERIRFEQELTPSAKLVAFVQYDNQRHWQSYFGLRLSFGGVKHTVGSESPLHRPIKQRLTDFIIRDLNVVIANSSEALAYQAPDYLLFVDNTVESSGDGSIKAPFASLDDALAVAKSSDLIFMETGTGTYDIGNITLHPNQRITSGHYDVRLPDSEDLLPFLDQERPVMVGTIKLTHGNQLHNLIVDGKNTEHYGIYGNYANFVRLMDLDVMHAKKNGIRIDNSTGVQMINTRIHNNAQQGLYLLKTHNTQLKHIQVDNNLKDGIYMKNSTHTVITGSQSTENDLRGIYAYQSTGTSTNNQWVNNVREGFLSSRSTFTLTNDSLRNNSVGTTNYLEAYGSNNSLLTFYGLKQLDGKFKAGSGGTLVMHTGEDIINIINGTIALGVVH